MSSSGEAVSLHLLALTTYADRVNLFLTMSSPSAATRVFAITELLEQIILEVMRAYDDSSLPEIEHWRTSYITDGFTLKRVSRDFNEVINGSTEIQNMLLTPRDPEYLSCLEPSRRRIWWITIASDLVGCMDMSVSRLRVQENVHGSPKREPFAHEAESSWRKITCLQRSAEPITVELWEDHYPFPLASNARSKEVLIDEYFTLGELYEEIFAMHRENRIY